MLEFILVTIGVSIIAFLTIIVFSSLFLILLGLINRKIELSNNKEYIENKKREKERLKRLKQLKKGGN